RQCRALQEELTLLAPWASLPPPPGGAPDLPGLRQIPTLRDVASFDALLVPAIDGRRAASTSPAEQAWLDQLRPQALAACEHARQRIKDIGRLVLQSDILSQMDYSFLYDSARRLLAIGYNVDERRRDQSYYDLLASEARFASFVTIAQGQLPQES